ncbi:MAG: hypothetical protein GMKNLPBB_01105 [Myxococcota bacterium]|nr:hypothetical protein [Myxococcota bacterium]
MDALVQLVRALEGLGDPARRIEALARAWRASAPACSAWMLSLLTGRRPRRLVNPEDLLPESARAAGMAPWLFEDCIRRSGDIAEVIALTCRQEAGVTGEIPLERWMENEFPIMRALPPGERASRLMEWRRRAPREHLLILNQLACGTFRLAAARNELAAALRQVLGVPAPLLAWRLMQDWTPSADFWRALGDPAGGDVELTRIPETSVPMEIRLNDLAEENADNWQAFWVPRGESAQLIRRRGGTLLWRMEEQDWMICPDELEAAARNLPDRTVLLGVVENGEAAKPARKNTSRKPADETDIRFIAMDILEWKGEDTRLSPFADRRMQLDQSLGGAGALTPQAAIPASGWNELTMAHRQSRARGYRGLDLRRRQDGGEWFRCLADPLVFHCVLTSYRQESWSEEAELTFAVWDGRGLVPVAAAPMRLEDGDGQALAGWLNSHFRERFGPVRTVDAQLVFELACEDVRPAPRRKAGLELVHARVVARAAIPASRASRVEDLAGFLPRRSPQ